MKRNIYISETPLESRIAIMEDKQLVEFYIETPEDISLVGNIYYAVIENVQAGMHAAFMNLGTEQNGFLGYSEIEQLASFEEGKWNVRPFNGAKDLQRGQRILVQVVKDAYANKGPRLTTDIAIPGRFAVLTPFSNMIGISKKIRSPQRRRLYLQTLGTMPREMARLVWHVLRGRPEQALDALWTLARQAGILSATCGRGQGHPHWAHPEGG